MSSDIFEKMGRAIVEEAYEDLYKEIGKQAIHAGGPQNNPALETVEFLDKRIAKEQILPRLTDELIEEHQKNPIGQHSDDLQRVLHFFQRAPPQGKYVIIELERNETWCLGILSGERGEPPDMLKEETYESLEEAQHAVFLKRVEDLRDRFEQEN